MKQLLKSAKLLVVTIFMCVCVTVVKAQSPAEDIGIGGSGSPTSTGLTGDGSPTVPFDGGMSLMLAVSGIAYASKRIKQNSPGFLGNA